MTDISVKIPKSYHDRAQELARREGLSIEQFVALSLAETLSVLEAKEYLEARAARGSREKYEAVLRSVKSRPPLPGDELPS